LSQADGLRYCTAAAFSSLKKYAAHFFNPDFVGTEPKEAAYAAAGVNSKKYLLNHLFIKISFCRKVTSILNAATTASEK